MADVTRRSATPPALPTLTLSDPDLRLIRQALQAYLACFSHDQAEITHRTKALLVKLHEFRTPDDPRNGVVFPSGRRLIL